MKPTLLLREHERHNVTSTAYPTHGNSSMLFQIIHTVDIISIPARDDRPPQ